MTNEVVTDNFLISNEYGQCFESAIRTLAMIKAGVIGDEWEVANKDFLISIPAIPYGDDEIVPWHHVCVLLTNGHNLYQVKVERAELERKIDKMKLMAWVNNANESSQA